MVYRNKAWMEANYSRDVSNRVQVQIMEEADNSRNVSNRVQVQSMEGGQLQQGRQ
jgi:hypothetical protein